MDEVAYSLDGVLLCPRCASDAEGDREPVSEEQLHDIGESIGFPVECEGCMSVLARQPEPPPEEWRLGSQASGPTL